MLFAAQLLLFQVMRKDLYQLSAATPRQFFAFKKFQRSTAAGGNVAHFVGQTGFFHRSNTVAAADDGNTAIGFDFSHSITAGIEQQFQ